MSDTIRTGRRGFIQTIAAGAGLAGSSSQTALAQAEASTTAAPSGIRVAYPRTFSGRQLAMLGFPLGGVGAGSISLGGRGQLRDWEIYNRPDKGRSPEYAFASIWAQSSGSKPVARVLEARLIPPYASAGGLGPANAPGLSRLESATFTGEFPMARIVFRDSLLPVRVSLEAFTPFIPLDPEASGLPVAVLRYRVRNTARGKPQCRSPFRWKTPSGHSDRAGPAMGG